MRNCGEFRMGADMQMLEKDGGENIHMYEKKFS